VILADEVLNSAICRLDVKGASVSLGESGARRSVQSMMIATDMILGRREEQVKTV
jgi:hypothetical protein